jgi:hypothetical protein
MFSELTSTEMRSISGGDDWPGAEDHWWERSKTGPTVPVPPFEEIFF